jgi:hypothetical protein
MSHPAEPLDDRHDPARHAQPPRRKLLPPELPRATCRTVRCSVCGRNIFSHLLLSHLQIAHDEVIYTRPSNGRPRSLWFQPLSAGDLRQHHRWPRR